MNLDPISEDGKAIFTSVACLYVRASEWKKSAALSRVTGSFANRCEFLSYFIIIIILISHVWLRCSIRIAKCCSALSTCVCERGKRRGK